MLTNDDFNDAAELLGVEPAILKAIRDVESGGKGFDDKGRLLIRFEGHWFRKFTGGRFDKQYPTISHPYYADGRNNKGGQDGERARLVIADKLDQDAAFKATSWGMFQIMGFNHALLNYPTVHDMINDFKTGERAHLMGLCRFIQKKGLVDELQRHDWRGFSYIYNGESYEKGGHHIKLESAYNRHKTGK